MAVTTIGVVYATKSGIVRRWIYPDDDADLPAKHPVSPGEAMLVVPLSQIKNVADIDAAVVAATGKQPPSARCAVLDAQGNVVGTLMADPDLDTVPGHTLVLHSTAIIGWSLTAGVLAAPDVTLATAV